MKKKLMTAFLALALVTGLLASAQAAVSADSLKSAVQGSAEYVYKTVKDPQVGSIGGEWAVLGLARSGCDVPEEYYQDYYATVEQYVEACKGVLHEKKYTEYSRVIVALSAIGRDARDVAGYDLTKALGDYEKTIWQGLNGPIWALIALDSMDYPMPQNPEAKTQATRQMYIDRILSCQLPDGGWSLFGGTAAASSGDGASDPDITGMALQALAKYQDQAAVAKATEEALACMSGKQDGQGGFGSWGTTNLESAVQMLAALCELGIPLDDARFVKNGKTILDNVLSYRQKDGSFLHTQAGGGSNQMATEQGLYALAAALRAAEGRPSLYRMTDHLTLTGGQAGRPKKGEGLEGKDSAVCARPITIPGKTFPDISGENAHENILAIEALAARGVVDGKSGGGFDPDGSMTRAEFAKIVVAALGLTPEAGGKFPDVPDGQWYAPYVGTASRYGIVNGGGDGLFHPEGTITRQEAAVMAANAARLCGMDTAMDTAAARDILAQFPDYVTSATWARPALAFCYREDILSQDDDNIRPVESITRAEVAQMLFNLLGSANLL